jgi:hypothetical protein
MAIISVSGRINSGKDEIGKIIQYLTSESYKKGRDYETFKRKQSGNLDMESHYIPTFKIKKFADKLKDIVCMLIGCTREQLEDRNFKEKELGEKWWYYKHGVTEELLDYQSHRHFDFRTFPLIKLTPRLILQILGTEAGRGLIHPNLWVNSLMSEYKSGGFVEISKNVEVLGDFPNWVVTDMRFPNEMEAVKKRNGITIRVNRYMLEQLPCYSCQGGGCPVCNGYGTVSNIIRLENEHESETALDEAEFDYVIYNNGTIEELIEKVKEILIKENLL